ncbi:hypothetical protein [uncultured Microbacterium sp.]|nr:hypothetical protein [uncultured Microbacterium sp.]
MSEEELTAWLEDWYDRWAGPGETWTMEVLAIGLCEAFTITPNRTIGLES